MGYGRGDVPGQAQDHGQEQVQGQEGDYRSTGRDVQEKDYRPAGREYPPGGRHKTGGPRGAVIGLTALAGTLMLLGGLWMAIIAITALTHGAVFHTAPAYIWRFNIRGWGWTELALACVLFAAGMCVFLGMAWARYVGAFFAVLSAIANFAFIPYQPAWSIIMLAVDAAIIWALLYPRRTPQEF